MLGGVAAAPLFICPALPKSGSHWTTRYYSTYNLVLNAVFSLAQLALLIGFSVLIINTDNPLTECKSDGRPLWIISQIVRFLI